MDIEGFGEKTVSTFLDAGLLADFADIYALRDRLEDIRRIEGFGGSFYTKPPSGH